jgi:O-antigen/teichoic acid export membrane protein
LASLLFSARYACAGPPLALLIFANGLLACMVLNLSLIAATDRPGLRMSIVLALLPVVVVLNLLFIPVWGLIGASAASLISLGLGAVVTAWIVHRLLALSPPGWTLLRCGLSGAVIFIAGRFWSVTGWWLLGEMALLGLGYLLLLFLSGELRREDYIALKRSLRS